MNRYQKHDLRALRAAPAYREYLGRLFSPYVKGARILEVGAGLGDLGRQLLEYEPQELVLLEPSEACFEELVRFTHPKVLALKKHTSELEEAETFDTIVYSNVLEHIEDDLQELKTAARLLKPGGHLAIIVPAHPTLYSAIDEKLMHYRRYNVADLEKLVAAVPSLEVVECRYINKVGAIGWLINKARRIKRQSSRLFAIFDRYFLPFSIKLDGVAPRSFGLSLYAVIRKAR